MNQKQKTGLKLLASIGLAAVSAASFAIWMYPQTVVYYSDASMSQSTGYAMYYCQSSSAVMHGTKSAYKKVLVAAEDCQSGGMPPLPN